MSAFGEQAQKVIPSEFRMISGCHDAQTSADVSNVGAFQLPNPCGKAGGACTAALLKVLYEMNERRETWSWVDVLRKMRTNLDGMGYEQVPQLTSSRMISVTDSMEIVPATQQGVRRAVLIGINYVGQSGELSGCHNDVFNVKDYLVNVLGFENRHITLLLDDGLNTSPTRENITYAYRDLVNRSAPGDVAFCHYSGHGGFVDDTSGDEEDGRDETLIPVDFQSAGQITDDELLKDLVHPMKAGVLTTCLMDCCHSGTVMDLPYRFTADGDNIQMRENPSSNMLEYGDLIATFAGAYALTGLLGAGGGMGGMGGGSPNNTGEEEEADCCTCIMDLVNSFL
mmetsp:Transcript_19165/g.22080  ORF Transcript_19165/g.22080 Transcript_19165/m.22080 type:complete len:340 (-) Transcript_19165:298-1317(-)